jgi:L-fuconolactonase
MPFPDAIVDSHVHLWNPAQFRYVWLDGLPPLNRAFLPADFSAASAKTRVARMIFVECGCEPSQSIAEVDWISALARQDPRLSGIVASAPLERGEAARDELAALAQRPLVKGVRRVLQAETDLEFCLRPDFISGVKLLEQLNFTFDLCIRHEQLRAVTELARRVPQVQFVLDHFGKPPVRERKMQPWATDLRVLARLPNVSCKISGLTTEADWKSWRLQDLRSYFEVALDAFGGDRVLFGGDWPVCTLAADYQTWVETVMGLTGSLDEKDRANLFRKNAERIYRV